MGANRRGHHRPLGCNGGYPGQAHGGRRAGSNCQSPLRGPTPTSQPAYVARAQLLEATSAYKRLTGNAYWWLEQTQPKRTAGRIVADPLTADHADPGWPLVPGRL